MQWFSRNVVGLLGVLSLLFGSLVTFYIKAEVNSRAIVQLEDRVTTLDKSFQQQNVAIRDFAIRTAQVEGEIGRFSLSNERLVIALDKLDAIYSSIKVIDALQDERISQLDEKLEKLTD